MFQLNRTTKFMMPLVIHNTYIDYFKAYLGIEKFADIDKKLIYLKQIKKNEDINNIISTIRGYYGKTYYKQNVVHIFELDNKFHDDYDKFIIGNYGGMSDITKNIIMQFWNTDKYRETIMEEVWKILYPNTPRFQVEKATELVTNVNDIETIINAISQVGEIDSIPKLTDEIILN